MEKISVIVPVYNVEKYLIKCVESIENQTYTDFEVILVDDGSADSSPKICDALVEKYGNIKVIHQTNAGASTARNRGIDEAEGKYIVFCDSDDCLAAEMLEKLMLAKEQYPEALPVCGIKKISANSELDCLVGGEKNFILPKKDFLVIQKAQLFNGPTNKLFEREIIERNNIRFRPEIKLGEDFIFNADYAICAGCDYSVIDEPLYYYYVDAENSVSKKYVANILDNYTKMDEKLCELMNSSGVEESAYDGRRETIQLFSVVNSIKNTLLPANGQKFAEKIRYIRKIVEAFDIKKIVSKADTKGYNQIYIKVLCTRIPLLIYLYRKIADKV